MSKEAFFKTLYAKSSDDDVQEESIYDRLRGPGAYDCRDEATASVQSSNSQTPEGRQERHGSSVTTSPVKEKTVGKAEPTQPKQSVQDKAACSKDHLSTVARSFYVLQEVSRSLTTLQHTSPRDVVEDPTESEAEHNVQGGPAAGIVIYTTNKRSKKAQAIISEKRPALDTKTDIDLLKHPVDREKLKESSKPDPLQQRTNLNTTGLATNTKASRKRNDPSKEDARSAKKRKKTAILKQLPERQRIFKDQHLYFLPNSDVNAARRFRIQKVLERGAVWARALDSQTTHIIVDKALNYNDVLKYLAVPEIPPGVVVVNEDWPADCIAYRRLVNPLQIPYRVARVEATNPRNSSPQTVTMTSSAPSPLHLKSKRRRAEPTMPSTPSPVEDTQELAAGRAIELAAKEQDLLHPQRTGSGTNALDEAINEAKQLGDLPLDECTDSVASSAESEVSEGASKSIRASTSPTDQNLTKSYQKSFFCMQRCDKDSLGDNPNSSTIETLKKMAEYYERTGDKWRLLSYRKAVAALAKQPTKISTKDEALMIRGIGQRLADKIEEIVQTSKLRYLENVTKDSNDSILKEFVNIYGVGPQQAAQWISQGYRTFEDLTSKAGLSRTQKIGIDKYDDFQTRIPREEVARHGELVKDALAKVDSRLEVLIGGSYRRGAANCGDIDFIITGPEGMTDSAMRTAFLSEMVPRLYAASYLKCELSVSSLDSPSPGFKWHGAASMPGSPPGIWRRIDFLLVPPEEFGASLIYFTGNDIFNRSIRLLASKKGYRLNQHGLWKDVLRRPGRKKVTQGTLVEGRSERRIFEILGVPWRPPRERNC